MLDALLSDDRPRSRALSALVLGLLALLLVFPFVFRGATALNAAAVICIFIILAASYDMLLGYTNIISFAHATFFGIGAYSVALVLKHYGNSWGVLAAGLLLGPLLTVGFAFLVGLLSLRVKALFFALVTLAVAAAFTSVLSSQYHLTGGEDGVLVNLPAQLRASYLLIEAPLYGFDLFGWIGSWFSGEGGAAGEWTYRRSVSGKLLGYYLILAIAVALFLLMLRFMNSPFGRVLQAIRENEFRARAIGFRPVVYRTSVFCLGSAIAAFAGGLYALWVGYTGPEDAGFNLMVGILIMVVVGGTGSIYGAVLGAAFLVLAQNYLLELVKVALGEGMDLTLPYIGNVLGELMHPNRWVMWMGLIYVLSVYFFSDGIAGSLRRRAAARRESAMPLAETSPA